METTKLIEFKKSLKTLKEGIEADINPKFKRDLCIKRFEYCFELSWKSIKEKLFEIEKLEANTPKKIISEAFLRNWINDEKIWIRMLQDRNLTTHTYKKLLSISIFESIPDYYLKMKEFQKILAKL